MPTSTTRTAVSRGLGCVVTLWLTVVGFAVQPPRASAQTTTFTYQGELTDSATAANGSYDLQFALFGGASGGTQIGASQTVL